MTTISRTLSRLPERFAMCQLTPDAPIPDWAMPRRATFFSITQTQDELSLICPQEQIPPDVAADMGWYCLKIEGPFTLDEPGVLASIVNPLSQAGISVFAVATYDTDYLLVKEFERAVQALEAATHRIIQGEASI